MEGYILLGFGDFTTMTFITEGLVPLIGATICAIGMSSRSQNGQVSVELRRAGVLLLPCVAAFWYMGFAVGWLAPLLGAIIFAFAATDGMPFGRILTTTANAVTSTTTSAGANITKGVARGVYNQTTGREWKGLKHASEQAVHLLAKRAKAQKIEPTTTNEQKKLATVTNK